MSGCTSTDQFRLAIETSIMLRTKSQSRNASLQNLPKWFVEAHPEGVRFHKPFRSLGLISISELNSRVV